MPTKPATDVLCCVDNCDRVLTGRGEGYGMCAKHYLRWRRHGDVNHVRAPKRVESCVIDGCGSETVGRGWCSKHYTRWIRYGDPTARMPGEIRDGLKVCPRCGEDKPLAQFTRPNDPCRACVADNMRARRIVQPTYTPVVRTLRSCDHCGTTFSADKRRRRYCTSECLNRHRFWECNARRRALLTDAFVEAFDRFEIFERDGWMCGICAEPIDPKLKWPHARSASVDHIIPLARGGKHERRNVQAAHLDCNVRKGAAVPILTEGSAA